MPWQVDIIQYDGRLTYLERYHTKKRRNKTTKTIEWGCKNTATCIPYFRRKIFQTTFFLTMAFPATLSVSLSISSSSLLLLLLGLSRLLLSVPQSRPLRLPPRLASVQEHPTRDGHPDKVLLIKWILSILISMKVSTGAGLGPKT